MFLTDFKLYNNTSIAPFTIQIIVLPCQLLLDTENTAYSRMLELASYCLSNYNHWFIFILFIYWLHNNCNYNMLHNSFLVVLKCMFQLQIAHFVTEQFIQQRIISYCPVPFTSLQLTSL